MTDRPIKPGDLVERTGETAMGLVKGRRYPVARADYARPPGLLYFDEAPDAGFRASGFRLVEEE